MPHNRRTRHRHPAFAVLSFVVALLAIASMVLWTLQLTATGSMSYMAHYSSTGAFYAAGSGLEMALKEISDGNDIDSDGVIGTISDNGNDADDPSLVSGSFNVQTAAKTYTANGRWRGFRRVLELVIQ
ncbi:MAG: hypothetical protein ACE5F9_10715 [Phycisphaerae bacterium]